MPRIAGPQARQAEGYRGKPAILAKERHATESKMGITVKLNGGVEIHVGDADFEALQVAFQAALADNTTLEVHSPDGRTIVLNPHNVLYVEGPSGETIAASNGAQSVDAPTPA
jgi:hypothetical protein